MTLDFPWSVKSMDKPGSLLPCVQLLFTGLGLYSSLAGGPGHHPPPSSIPLPSVLNVRYILRPLSMLGHKAAPRTSGPSSAAAPGRVTMADPRWTLQVETPRGNPRLRDPRGDPLVQPQWARQWAEQRGRAILSAWVLTPSYVLAPSPRCLFQLSLLGGP